MTSESIKESRKAALESEAELWEFLIQNDLESKFKKWVIEYRKQQNHESNA